MKDSEQTLGDLVTACPAAAKVLQRYRLDHCCDGRQTLREACVARDVDAEKGQSSFGFSISEWVPYTVSRTWQVQLAVFWIATAFLAAGLFLAPAVGGREPKWQRLGVNLLLVASKGEQPLLDWRTTAA